MGHTYEATPNNRVRGKGCPYCSGRRILPGKNDLLTKNPELAAEWDYEKNYPIRPEDIMPGRNKTAWWICKNCGHNWKAVINSRSRGSGCPKCAKRFQSSFPEQKLKPHLQWRSFQCAHCLLHRIQIHCGIKMFSIANGSLSNLYNFLIGYTHW